MDSISNGYGCRPMNISVSLDGSGISNLNASNIASGTMDSSHLQATGVTQGTYGSALFIPQINVDQYGRITSAANIATNVTSQWTTINSNVAFGYGVTIGQITNPVPGSNLYVTGNVYITNVLTATNVFASTINVTGSVTCSTLYGPIAGANTGAFSNVFASAVYGPIAGANTGAFSNLYSANAVTTTNVFASTINVTGSVTSSTFYGSVAGANTGAFSNLYSANAVTTTNLFAVTETLTGAAGQTTLGVTGNVYVSNSLTTTNLTCAGFTSNVSNTVFNFDTLTIPFVSCTTLNVATTSNLQVATLTGSAGQTSLGVTGNVYVSNSLTTTNVFATTVNTINPIPYRNRLINGAMTVWQRNVASISTTASQYTTADRWCGALGTSGLILSQWPGPTEAPQFPYSLQVITSTTTSGTPLVEQRIENLNIPDFLNGTPVTVSFYAGQTYGTLMPLTVGLYYATAVNNFGTQTLAVTATQNTPTLTASNVYYTLSFTLNTSLGATNGLAVRFTTGASSALGSTFLLTGVQVEKGAVPTPFEFRPYAIDLALAQRYYYQLTSPTTAQQGSSAVYSIFGTATGITTTAFWLPIQFPVPMRNPNYSVSNSAITNFQLLPTGTTTITAVGVQSDSYTTLGATLNFVGTNIVPTASYIFRTNNLTGSNVAYFGFSCEL